MHKFSQMAAVVVSTFLVATHIAADVTVARIANDGLWDLGNGYSLIGSHLFDGYQFAPIEEVDIRINSRTRLTPQVGDYYYVAVSDPWYRWNGTTDPAERIESLDVVPFVEEAFVYDDVRYYTGIKDVNRWGIRTLDLYAFDGETITEVPGFDGGIVRHSFLFEEKDMLLFRESLGGLYRLQDGIVTEIPTSGTPNAFLEWDTAHVIDGYVYDRARMNGLASWYRTDGELFEQVQFGWPEGVERELLYDDQFFATIHTDDGRWQLFKSDSPDTGAVQQIHVEGPEINANNFRSIVQGWGGNVGADKLFVLARDLSACCDWRFNLYVLDGTTLRHVPFYGDQSLSGGVAPYNIGGDYFLKVKPVDSDKWDLFTIDHDFRNFELMSDEEAQEYEWLEFYPSSNHTYTTPDGAFVSNIIFKEGSTTEIDRKEFYWTDGKSVQQLIHEPSGVALEATENVFEFSGAHYIWDVKNGLFKIVGSDSVARVDYDHSETVSAGDIDIQTEVMLGGEFWETFDLNQDGAIDLGDRRILVQQFAETGFGDSNLDGRFDSADFVIAFQYGEYEDALIGNSTWSEGDWNGDGDFTTRDIVLAFQDGNYELDSSSFTVPEPISSGHTVFILLFVSRFLSFVRFRNRLKY
ncbi:MAG: hypothetical protein KDB27_13075 [Planctomycetales bacterium]|nr:hypothetical protein [Planctomycetales bacterium]